MFQVRYIPSVKDIPSKRQPMPEAPVEERKTNFKEVELGYSQEQAMQEASRCLTCRQCLGCGLCAAVCHAKAVDLAVKDNELEMEVDSIILTPEAGGAKNIAPGQYDLYKNYQNSVDFIQFNHILYGLYGGLILRPSDGRIPRKIAFVLEENNPGLLSMAERAAELARNQSKGLEIRIIGHVLEVSEIADKNLIIKLKENGKSREEQFEMMVWFGWLNLPAYFKELGLSINNRAFLETGDSALKESGKANIFLAGYQLKS